MMSEREVEVLNNAAKEQRVKEVKCLINNKRGRCSANARLLLFLHD